VVLRRVGEGEGESPGSAIVDITMVGELVGMISGSTLVSVDLGDWVGDGVMVGTGAKRVGSGCASIEHPASKMMMGKSGAKTARRTWLGISSNH